MKPVYQITCLLILSLSVITCHDQCKKITNFTYYTPVYSTSQEIKNAVTFQAPRQLTSPGKIYFKDDYLFINETGKGIHVIDNRNPASPMPVGFLNIPGNYDLAMANDLLYADSFVDLVVFDTSNKSEIHEVNRLEGVFNQVTTFSYPIISGNLVVTSWKKQETVNVQEYECYAQVQPWGGFVYNDGIALFNSANASSLSSIQPLSAGTGGSMARFTVDGNNLYALNGSSMKVVSLTNPNQPKAVNDIEISWDVETLFPYGNNLFAGSRTGMYIYDLTVADDPKLVTKYLHAMSCDPVVVSGTIAYLTTRSDNACRRGVNQLEVVDIANIKSPQSLKTYPMVNPHGLGIDSNILFICDGQEGLKVYDASQLQSITNNQIAHYPGIQAIDVIPLNGIAMMISSDGLYQYDYSDPTHIFQISKLPIVQ